MPVLKVRAKMSGVRTELASPSEESIRPSTAIRAAMIPIPNKALLAKRILLCGLFAGKETG